MLALLLALTPPPAHDVHRFPNRQVVLVYLAEAQRDLVALEQDRQLKNWNDGFFDWERRFARSHHRIACWQALERAWGACRTDRRQQRLSALRDLLGAEDYAVARMPGRP